MQDKLIKENNLKYALCLPTAQAKEASSMGVPVLWTGEADTLAQEGKTSFVIELH